jgi:hypothetical protein
MHDGSHAGGGGFHGGSASDVVFCRDGTYCAKSFRVGREVIGRQVRDSDFAPGIPRIAKFAITLLDNRVGSDIHACHQTRRCR